jgi:hypothetical protein
MSTIRTLLAVSGLVVLSAAGCAQPGVIETHPATGPEAKDAGKTVKDAGKKPVVSDDDDSTADDDDDSPGDDDADDDAPVDTKKDAGSETPRDDASAAKDAGKVTTEKDAGDKPADDLPPCPTGYTCKDPASGLASMGLSGTVTDPDGKPIKASCTKDGLETCDPKDLKKSCPNFTAPYCATIDVTGLFMGSQCVQNCTP